MSNIYATAKSTTFRTGDFAVRRVTAGQQRSKATSRNLYMRSLTTLFHPKSALILGNRTPRNEQYESALKFGHENDVGP
jgi:hypothetical protein